MVNSQMETSRPKSLNSLISLRFFAAAVIVIHHSKGSFGLDSQWLMDLQTAQPVSFFFVLSGFIMTYVHPSLEGRKDFSRFLIARIARIWPLHVATFLLTVILFPVYLRNPGGQDTPSLLLANLLMLQSWIPIWNYYFSYNSVSWAVSTEFAFYLLFPWLLYRWRRTWHIKILGAFLVVIAVVSSANLAGFPSGQDPGTTGHVGYSGLVYIGPLGRFFEFVLGMSLSMVFQRMTLFYSPGRTAGTIIEGVALALAVGTMAISSFIALSIFRHLPWIGESGRNWLLGGGLPCGFYGLLILVMAMEKGLISRFLSCGFLRGVGEMSFSIFLLHQILVRYYQWRIEDATDLPGWFLYGYFWAVLLLGAYVLMVLVERPCRRFILGLGQYKRITMNIHPEGTESLFWGISSGNASGNVLSSWLIGKRHILFAGCSLLMLLVVMPHFFRGVLTIKNAIDQTLAVKITDNWESKYQRIQFGNRFLLRGAHLAKLTDKIRLQLIWENMNEQRLEYKVAVHVLNDGGSILFQADYPQNKAHMLVRKHVVWLEEAEIPLEKLSGAAFIGIALYSAETQKILLPDRGDRDLNNQRLLIVLPGQS